MKIDTFDATLDLSLDAQEEIGEIIDRAIKAGMKHLGLPLEALSNYYYYPLDIPVSLDIDD